MATINLSNADGKYNFPFGLKILTLQRYIFFLIFFGILIDIIPLFIWLPCKPETRFEPCNFGNKIPVNEIIPLKKEINETQNITETYKLQLIAAPNDISNQQILKSQQKLLKQLTEKYEYQKIHRTQCYIENLEKEKFRFSVIFKPFHVIYFGVGLLLIPLFFRYFFAASSLNLSTEEKVSRRTVFRDCLYLLIFYLIIAIPVAYVYIFFNGFERDRLENLPLFIVENTKNFCGKRRH